MYDIMQAGKKGAQRAAHSGWTAGGREGVREMKKLIVLAVLIGTLAWNLLPASANYQCIWYGDHMYRCTYDDGTVVTCYVYGRITRCTES
jgi:hypothetical protein